MTGYKEEIIHQIPEQKRWALDEILSRLQAAKDKWANYPISKKLSLLQNVRQNLDKYAEEWVTVANANRQIAPDSPWAAEEWYEIFTVAILLSTNNTVRFKTTA